MSEPLEPPVFIIGCPRSGTTWLYHLLLSAGGFAIYRTEAQVFASFAPLLGSLRSATQRHRFVALWLASERFLRSGLDAAEIGPRLERCRTAGDCQREIMDAIARDQGARRWADCTPENGLYIREIMRAFPNALFVHIIRDGRDVALSLGKIGWAPPLPGDRVRPALAAGAYWDWMIGLVRARARHAGARYTEIRYEDLVRRPHETIQSLGQFLAHELDYERIQRVAIGTVRRPNTSFLREAKAFQPIERWRTRFDPEELRELEAMIGPTLTAIGYSLATRAADSRESSRAQMRRALYSASFASRLVVRRWTPLGNRRATAMLTARPPLDEGDPTLRPGLHRDFIRQCVNGADATAVNLELAALR